MGMVWENLTKLLWRWLGGNSLRVEGESEIIAAAHRQNSCATSEELIKFGFGWFIVLLLLLFPTPAWALPSAAAVTPLTIELLQDRLNSPRESEGVFTIDLRKFVIDLRDDNAEFRDRFYQELQTKINRYQQPLGLDFSDSVIYGELTASRFGLLTPLVKDALPSLLTPWEEKQLEQSQSFVVDYSTEIPGVILLRVALKLNRTIFTDGVNFANTFFLHWLEAVDAKFYQPVNFSDTHFSRNTTFSRTLFAGSLDFSNSTFFEQADFRQVEFRGMTNFTSSTFYSDTNFNESEFFQLANFSKSQWLAHSDFSEVVWRDRSLFTKSYFAQSLLLTSASFAKSTTFRECLFQQPVVWHNVSLLDQVDFSNARFAPDADLNVEGLTFDSDLAKIIGDSGEIGRRIYVPILAENEYVFRNLIHNFRQQQQIADANQIEYKRERLQRRELRSHLLCTAGIYCLSPRWIIDGLHWMGLSLLLLLSKYGTSCGLVFGVGAIAIAYFGLLFWLIDRWRRLYPTAIIPTYLETIYMLVSFTILNVGGAIAIFRTSDRPWLTLLCLVGILVPIPVLLVARLYQEGRYHDLLDTTYFVEDGGMRQFHLSIGRLPIIPRFPLNRDRYMPILWNRRWNWLNYYDFSLNNLFKFGINDIRLRDQHLPGIITTLAWYQWSLGLLYLALLLWTLSRTIPGLNLLIYLK